MVQGLSHNNFIQGMEKELERTGQISDLLWRLSWQEMDTEGEENVSSFHGQMNGRAQKEQWNMNRLGEVGDHEVCLLWECEGRYVEWPDGYIWVLSSQEKFL